ncbi:carbohydrate ABC transporter permease [Roseomonas elaeocarpi]|uniref:Carbohydrate ABC transporter permease n=1 Tax=Roseomonas elaeocarpi TaxID=907779 RepID=A0ABV6JNM3_9PROT
MRKLLAQIGLYALASAVAVFFAYPFWWMFVASFRTQEQILSAPLRLLPERFDLAAWRSIRRLGGEDLSTYAINSFVLTTAATLLGVAVMGIGAYALYRRPSLPGFRPVRYGFMLTIMYPHMLLVIPLYFVTYRLGLLGTWAGLVLVLALVPLVFFLFDQFFRAIPREMLEAAQMDGASEAQTFLRVVLPIARPVVTTSVLIAFLLTWKQWFPILVLSAGPDTYTLPVALLALNSEWGINVQATMALSTLTTLPVIVLFVLTQRKVMSGFLAGATKG